MKQQAKQKKKTWTKLRHKIITATLRYPVGWYCRLRYGFRVPRRRDWIRQQSLILLNHQTPFDQFFVGLCFKDPVYYMATEDIFSNGWVSKLIKYLVAPIPIKKQTTDVQAVMNCIKVVREGGSLAIAPEGNRTYSGKTEYMNPAIAPLAKKLGLPIVLLRIEGGYGKEPRWSDVVRSGSLKAYPGRVISPEEAKAMTNEELYEAIRDGLYVNEACVDHSYRHRNLAQYMERAIYVCPQCGLSTFESKGDILTCKSCGRQTRYLPTKELEGVGSPSPFRFVNDWYEYQKQYVNSIDPTVHTEKPIYEDVANLSEVIVYKQKNLLQADAPVKLYGDRIELGERVLPFADISTVAVLGKNKLNIYYKDQLFQLKSHKRFCALKYVNLFYRCKNIMRGEQDGEFLGL